MAAITATPEIVLTGLTGDVQGRIVSPQCYVQLQGYGITRKEESLYRMLAAFFAAFRLLSSGISFRRSCSMISLAAIQWNSFRNQNNLYCYKRYIKSSSPGQKALLLDLLP